MVWVPAHPLPNHMSPAVQGRLSDSNANLVARALCLAGELATATGAAWDRVGRPLLNPALLGLADKKKQACRTRQLSGLASCPAWRDL